jgi:hypothetical protein
MNTKRWIWRIAAGLGLVLVALVGAAFVMIGPRDLIGILRYDQRREGSLKVGDRAPDVLLAPLDGSAKVRLLDRLNGRPLVIVFGSFT